MNLVSGAVVSVIRKLGKLLQEEYKLQKGLPAQIESLKNELESAHTALRKVGETPPEQLDEQIRLWARDVREASYDMEDILDAFLVDIVDVAGPAEHKDGLRKHLQMKMVKLFKKSKARHSIAGAIKEMRKRLQEVSDRRDRFYVPVAVPAPVTTVDPRLTVMYKEAAQIIGIDKAKEDLIAMLLSSSHGHRNNDVSGSSSNQTTKIFSVVGAGGLGKTTLAKAVYDELKPRYDCGAFLSVGRKPDMVQVFRNIFFLLDKEYEAIRDVKNLQLLIGELQKFLENDRYFIVIDDVWDTKSWEIIKSALPHKTSGSRVIITTRNREVASSEEIYELVPLSCDNSKRLFHMRLFGGRECPDDLYDVSDKILEKCGGVPLAIVTMASLLVGKSRQHWFEVCNSPGFNRRKYNKQVDDTVWILSLSYYDLPSNLRTCLLYLSAYPEDYLIEKDFLIWKWIAEGFIEKKTGTSLFQQGEEYFHHLINRSMIQAVEIEKSIIYGCYVHDMVLDLIRDLSDEENFISISNDDEEGTSSPNKVRRIAHQYRLMKQTHLDNRMDMAHVRSLVACSCDVDGWVVHPGFKLLRVLDLQGYSRLSAKAHWDGLKHLGNLIHLRYLGLAFVWLTELPVEIGNLKLLQTLDLCGNQIFKLPTTISLLTQLLCLRCDFSTSAPDGFLRKVTSLEELHISPGKDDESVLQFMKELDNQSELRVLTVHSYGRIIGDFVAIIIDSLGNLHKLQRLQLCNYGLNEAYIDWDTAAVLPRELQHLRIVGTIWFRWLPSCINPADLPNLVYLELRVDDMNEAGLRALGALPKLRFLDLGGSYSRRTPCKATVSNIIAADGFFQELRSCMLGFWTVQLTRNEQATGVSFTICKGKDAEAFGSIRKDECSIVSPAVVVMPNVQELEFYVLVRAFYRDGYGICENLGLECLASLQRVKVNVDCKGAFVGDVEKAEAELRHAAQLHPNRPIIEIVLWKKYRMVARPMDQDNSEESDDDDMIEAVCKKMKAVSSAGDKVDFTDDDYSY